MRTLILLIFILTSGLLFSQDTSVTWMNKIDTATFKMFYNKESIPKDFYKIIGIDKQSEIVSANKPYRHGCLGGLPGHRLNWLAKDKNNHWVLSISFGGRANGTKYLFIDSAKGKLNVNGFRFYENQMGRDLTFGGTLLELKKGQYFRLPVDVGE